MENTLHPNLARIAATYQQILGRLSRGEVDLVHAHSEIRDLIARDDQGVQWTINPRDGGWLFLSRNGSWMPADPPRSGYATITPHDLRELNNEHVVAYNPDWDITLQKVEQPPQVVEPRALNTWKKASIGVAVALLAAVLWLAADGDTEKIAPGAPETTLTLPEPG